MVRLTAKFTRVIFERRDELIKEYQKMSTDVAALIKQRELPVLIKLKERSDL